MPAIILGITIGLLASFIQSLGLTIQRKSHILNERLPEHLQRVEHRRPLWIIGFTIFITSNILGSLIQIASLPVVILAPLGAVSLLWNAFFARFLLGDVFSPWLILGTLLIAGGAVLIAFFGIVPELTRALEDLLILFQRPTFIVYFSCLAVVVIVCLTATHIAEYSWSRHLVVHEPNRLYHDVSQTASPNVATEPSVLATGVTEVAARASLLSEETRLLDSKSKSYASANSFLPGDSKNDPISSSSDRTRILLAISYASFSGILSGMCLIFAKSGVELLMLTIKGKNQFWRWQAWLLVLGLIAFALLQLWYLHKALILADPTLVCPSAFCFYNLSSIINGLVYFNQLSLIPALHLILVAIGMVTLLGGVWVVSIHSGSGVVEIATWAEDEAETSEDAMSDTGSLLHESPDDEPTMSHRSWGVNSDPQLRNISEGDSEAPTSPLSTITCPLPSSSIAQREQTKKRFLYHNRHPTFGSIGGYARRYHSFSLGKSPTSPPPSNTAQNTLSSLASAGFQIGLSPLSPGFSIVPLERRIQRDTENTDEIESGQGDIMQRRRTVSEGDTRQKNKGRAAPHSPEHPRPPADTSEGTSNRMLRRQDTTQSTASTGKWRQRIRRIFSNSKK